MAYAEYHITDSDPGEPIPKCVRKMQFYSQKDFEKFDRDVFAQITPEMRRKHAGHILCVSVETRKILFFLKSRDEPWGEQYVGVPIMLYQMPRAGSPADPTLVN